MKVMDACYAEDLSGRPRETCAVASNGERDEEENCVGRLGMSEGGILDPGSGGCLQFLAVPGGMENGRLLLR